MQLSEISLSKNKWQLMGFNAYTPLRPHSAGVDFGSGITEWIDASVPGAVHIDLYRAGIIEDPYFEMNSLKCAWVEQCWWVYRTTFNVSHMFKERDLELCFEGLDYKAHVFLNQRKIGEHEGIYHPLCIDVTKCVQYDQENELIIVLENAPEGQPQLGDTSVVKTMKSRFSYKWDFCPRLVNLGIWKDVKLKSYGKFKINDLHVNTIFEHDKANLEIVLQVNGIQQDCVVKNILTFDGSIIGQIENKISPSDNEFDYKVYFTIEEPHLWYPINYGEQPLYELDIEIIYKEQISDKKNLQVGVRKLEYIKNEGAESDALPYTVMINGKKIYIKGVNFIPVDIFCGTVKNETYDRHLLYMKNAGVNLVRVWGGGIIESEYFYSLCDRYGIMVWQEFMQTGSGGDSIPSAEKEYLELLETSMAFALKQKRNHVSHTFWSGGNELYEKGKIPVAYSNSNIAFLKLLVEKYDPGKLFLPSSPSGPIHYISPEAGTKNHDIHGSWNYMGAVDHYKLYNSNKCLFHSEFGVAALNFVKEFNKFLSHKNIKNEGCIKNLAWRFASQWWDYYERDNAIFGAITELERAEMASQLVQADGVRYIIEANRRQAFYNSGSIIWQFNDLYPIPSSTSMVDYYGNPKMIYYSAKNFFANKSITLSHEGLICSFDKPFMAEIFTDSTEGIDDARVQYEILDIKGNVLGSATADICLASQCPARVMSIKTQMPELKNSVFFIRLKLLEKDAVLASNLYIFSQKEKEPFADIFNVKGGKLSIEKDENNFHIRNIGDEVCMCVNAVSKDAMLVDNNYVTLFPGEEMTMKIITGGENVKIRFLNEQQ